MPDFGNCDRKLTFLLSLVTHHTSLIMTADQAAELVRAALMMTLLIGAPVLLAAIIVGLFISILQAVTQLQDQTLSFVPKIVAMLVTLIIVFPWVMTRMIEYSTTLIREIPSGL